MVDEGLRRVRIAQPAVRTARLPTSVCGLAADRTTVSVYATGPRERPFGNSFPGCGWRSRCCSPAATGWTTFGGFAGAGLYIHLMQMIDWLMIALFVWLFHGPWLAFKRAVDVPSCCIHIALERRALERSADGVILCAVVLWSLWEACRQLRRGCRGDNTERGAVSFTKPKDRHKHHGG
jgi:hypothetical protein